MVKTLILPFDFVSELGLRVEAKKIYTHDVLQCMFAERSDLWAVVATSPIPIRRSLGFFKTKEEALSVIATLEMLRS